MQPLTTTASSSVLARALRNVFFVCLAFKLTRLILMNAVCVSDSKSDLLFFRLGSAQVSPRGLFRGTFLDTRFPVLSSRFAVFSLLSFSLCSLSLPFLCFLFLGFLQSLFLLSFLLCQLLPSFCPLALVE